MKHWNIDNSGESKRGDKIVERLRNMQLLQGFSILDVACGHGEVIMRIADLMNCEATAIDINDDENWNGKVSFIQTDLEDFISTDRKFDVVIMLNSYRNWQGEIKDKFDAWVKRNATYFITSGTNCPFIDKQHIGRDTHDYDMYLYTI